MEACGVCREYSPTSFRPPYCYIRNTVNDTGTYTTIWCHKHGETLSHLLYDGVRDVENGETKPELDEKQRYFLSLYVLERKI